MHYTYYIFFCIIKSDLCEENMKDNVLIKGNQYGLKIIINNDCDLQVVYDELKNKIISGRKFFSDMKISLEINYLDEKLELTDEVATRVVDIIEKNSDLKVFCIVDKTMKVVSPKDIKTKIKKVYVPVEEKKASSNVTSKKHLEDGIEYARFYQGTLRSGQQLKSDNSIVFVGDVNPGAKIISTGNIIVLGTIKGFAHAGATGKNRASIFAVNLQPTQLRIGEFIARAPERYEGTGPSVAFVENDRIVIDNIDKGLLKDFVLLK